MKEFSERRLRTKRVEESDVALLRRAEQEDVAIASTRTKSINTSQAPSSEEFFAELKRIREELTSELAKIETVGKKESKRRKK